MIPFNLYSKIADNVPILCVDGLIIHKGKYLLLERKNKPLKGQYWIPGGRVLKNEPLKDAFIRKMKEETGLDVKIVSCAGFYEDFFEKNELCIDSVHTVGIVFVATPLNTDVKLDDQSSNYIWSERLPDEFKIKFFNN